MIYRILDCLNLSRALSKYLTQNMRFQDDLRIIDYFCSKYQETYQNLNLGNMLIENQIKKLEERNLNLRYKWNK